MKTCTAEGCPKKHLAKGLCSTHYNQTQPNRHRKVTVECGWCGKACTKGQTARFANRFCSYDCRDTMRACQSGLLVCDVPLSHRAHPQYTPPLPVLYLAPMTAPPRAPRIAWVAGRCKYCGATFVDRWLAESSSLYCSHRCAKRMVKDRYRARKRSAFVADVSPTRIFVRDGWRCQLCRGPVARDRVVPHPRAAVIDHIIPLAAGVEAGGVHAPHNVQCAHFMCNSIKSDRIITTQLALFG